MKEFYLDYAATSPIDERVLTFIKPYLEDKFENPSSMYIHAIENRKAINEARKKIADALNVMSNEIYFTSGGTESINWAIKGYAEKHLDKKEIITSKVEHEATLKTLHFLEKKGYKVHYLDVDQNGFINLEELELKINENTLMVSIIFANNEIGTIQDVNQISRICKRHQTKLHLDAVQAFGQLNLDLKVLDVDFLTISSHKFYGPKGAGVLYVKNNIEIEPLIHGGLHENGHRAGTENLHGIIGMGEAARLIKLEMNENAYNYKTLQYEFHKKMIKAFKNIILIGPVLGEKRSFNHLSYAFKDILGYQLQFQLNKLGVFVSTGSACHAQSIEPSHVIKAINLDEKYQPCIIRVTFGKHSRLSDQDEIIQRFKEAYQELTNL